MAIVVVSGEAMYSGFCVFDWVWKGVLIRRACGTYKVVYKYDSPQCTYTHTLDYWTILIRVPSKPPPKHDIVRGKIDAPKLALVHLSKRWIWQK